MNVASPKITYSDWCKGVICENKLCKAGLNIYIDDLVGAPCRYYATFVCCECGTTNWVYLLDDDMWSWVKAKTKKPFNWFGLRRKKDEDSTD